MAKKIHVFHLIDGLTFGGAETLLRDLASGLENLGYRVTVGYSTPGPFVQVLEKEGLHLVRIPRLGLVDPMFLLRIMRIIQKDPPHVFHTHLFKSDFHGRFAARFMGVPVVVSTLHNNDVWANNWIMGHLYGLTSIWADLLIAVSPEVKEFHCAKTGVSENKIQVIKNSVDVNAFSGYEEEGSAIRAEFGFVPSSVVYGIVGRLKEQKNVSMFLKAAAEIKQQQPDARFLVVGDGPLLSDLKGLAKELDLLPSLVFTGMRKDIPEILKSLDVLVLSSLWEGLPVVLLEAMAASLPVVSTAVDGVIGVVQPDVTAFLVPSGDHAKLAEACLKLGRDPELRMRMGQAGKKLVSEEYSLDNMITRISDQYISLLQSKRISIPAIRNAVVEREK